MTKINLMPHRDVDRSDTLTLHTHTPYDPNAPRATKPIMVGQFVVARRPYSNTQYTLYSIMDGSTVLRESISMPSLEDCASALTKHRITCAAAGKQSTPAAPKSRRPTPLRVKAVA
jgi:hypothetical protein